jgi:RNA polymerase sigma factor (sigma-70 family)
MLYRKFGTSVYRFSWHMLGSREDAEDATQATFLAVHAALASGTDVREPQAWVMKIARNECLQKITQRMRRPLTDSIDADEAIQLAAAGPSVSRQAELNGELGAASEALGRLPTSQREAFVLREWVGMSTAEIALSLGTTVSAVDALLNRARRELIRVVGGNEGVASCAETREALADGLLDRSARAHLVRCKSCRAARRAIHPQVAAVRSLVPPAVIAERLGAALPGFASSAASGAAGAAGGAAAGGTGIAAVIAKLASAPVAIKGMIAAMSAAAAVGGGIAVHDETTHSVHHPAAPAASVRHLASAAPVQIVQFTAPPAAPVAPVTSTSDDTHFASATTHHSSSSEDSGTTTHSTGGTSSRTSGDDSTTTTHHHHSTTGSGGSDDSTTTTHHRTWTHQSDDGTGTGSSDDSTTDPSDDSTHTGTWGSSSSGSTGSSTSGSGTTSGSGSTSGTSTGTTSGSGSTTGTSTGTTSD